MNDNLSEVHTALTLGINYFASKHKPCVRVDCSRLGLREKVGMFAELLPASADRDYTWRFTGSLVRILWLDSERERISRFQGVHHRWLFPFYAIADGFKNEALELYESLNCEHDDYKAWLGSCEEMRPSSASFTGTPPGIGTPSRTSATARLPMFIEAVNWSRLPA